jgi:hypothetical protein
MGLVDSLWGLCLSYICFILAFRNLPDGQDGTVDSRERKDDVANVLLVFSAGDQTQVHMQAKQALHL